MYKFIEVIPEGFDFKYLMEVAMKLIFLMPNTTYQFICFAISLVDDYDASGTDYDALIVFYEVPKRCLIFGTSLCVATSNNLIQIRWCSLMHS